MNENMIDLLTFANFYMYYLCYLICLIYVSIVLNYIYTNVLDHMQVLHIKSYVSFFYHLFQSLHHLQQPLGVKIQPSFPFGTMFGYLEWKTSFA
jgi:hypothetical protein